MTGRARTLGELKLQGYAPRTVKEEIAANAVGRIRAGKQLVDGMVGFGTTVLPQLERAILARHDVIFLGERGQGKTRLIRSLASLLDEWVPAIEGSELNDDPLWPLSKVARGIVEELGDLTPIRWMHREERFSEKLATPDTSIADLVGEVDPIKVAEGRYLADEETMHFGLVPRTNRGIFAINELPDLPERIQVGLLNLLEERDVQLRGYKIRLPLDIMFVASSNPEDYTNRGRLITPLKDRFGTQIRTHYPLSTEEELEIVAKEAQLYTSDHMTLKIPSFMGQLVVAITHLARQSSSINQRSGVSVRMSIACFEVLGAAAVARAIRQDEDTAVPRPSDLDALVPAISGKIEIDSLDDTEEPKVIGRLISQAITQVYRARVNSKEVLDAQKEVEEAGFTVSSEFASAYYAEELKRYPALERLATFLADGGSQGEIAGACELVLEGLHLAKRLNRSDIEDGFVYIGR